MMKNKLIFIEGVSGVGKTTSSSRLCNELRDMGATYVCHLEGDPDNPLDPFDGMFPPAISRTEFADAYTTCWQRFVESQLLQSKGFILDGTLFHHQINDLLRYYNASDESIVTHLMDLIQMVQPLNPIVLYLASCDVGQRLSQAQESRGLSAPTDEKIAFWKNRKRVDMLVLERLPVESHILNIDNGWDIMLEIMTVRVKK